MVILVKIVLSSLQAQFFHSPISNTIAPNEDDDDDDVPTQQDVIQLSGVTQPQDVTRPQDGPPLLDAPLST